jgi:hypothetical protein
MAQDLEKSRLGKSMVSIGPDGYKQISYNPSILQAEVALLNQKIRQLEGMVSITDDQGRRQMVHKDTIYPAGPTYGPSGNKEEPKQEQVMPEVNVPNDSSQEMYIKVKNRDGSERFVPLSQFGGGN